MRTKVWNEEQKSQLATEIYGISNRQIACVHLHRRAYANGKPFIDWYLILNVSDKANLDAIKKQYHKLALQLHPDKNKHSKAETAFKLVSEAYFCLSDNARRASFDSKRKNISCIQCNTNSPSQTNVKIRIPNQETSRSDRVQRRISELQTKLKNEATIIEKCLTTRRKSSALRTELPVFNPSDYKYKEYPHHRTINLKNLENLRDGFMIRNRCIGIPRKNDSPVFEYRS